MMNDYVAQKEVLGGWRAVPLWVVFFILLVVTFSLPWAEDDLRYFYIDQLPLTTAMVLFVCAAFYGALKIKIPLGFYYFTVSAVFIWWQARALHLPMTGPNDMAAAVFLIGGFLYWAVKGLVAKYGQEQVLTVVAWLLLMGALFQSMVAILQLTEWMAPWGGYIFYSGGEPSGQVGQRNHLGHYMMWGVLATAYLWHAKKTRPWLAVACLIALVSVLGVVRSRTIFVYLLALLPVLAILWWKVSRRAAAVLAASLVLVGVMQVVSPMAVTHYVTSGFESALQRAGGSGFAQSGRHYEWLKAWEAFKRAPLLGHGWDGYAAQSFVINNYPDGYRTYDFTVLFNHCHNLILQLLASVGGTGVLLIVGGFVGVAVYSLKRGFRPASWFVLAMMMVSICHSMLEYPLWYLNFFTGFVVLFALLGEDAETIAELDMPDSKGRSQLISKAGFAGFLAVFVMLVYIVRMQAVYYQMTRLNTEKLAPEQEWSKDVTQWMYLYNHEPFLKEMALIKLAVKTTKLAYSKDAPPQWAARISDELAKQRPYSLIFYQGLYLERQGKHQEALAWLDKVYRYYPQYMAAYEGELRRDARFAPLYPQAAQACTEVAKLFPDFARCQSLSENKTK